MERTGGSRLAQRQIERQGLPPPVVHPDRPGDMFEILAILAGVCDLATVVLGVAKYWRISCGFLIAASALVVVSLAFSSPAIRWIVGFHVFVLLVTIGIIWEQKRGRLK